MSPQGLRRGTAALAVSALVVVVLATFVGPVSSVAAAEAPPPAAGDRWQGPPELRRRVADVLATLPPSARDVLSSARLTYGCHPRTNRCTWGAYDLSGTGGRGRFTVWIGPDAFANDARLRYVVVHELAHHLVLALQPATMRDVLVEPFGDEERHADCVAAALGAPGETRRTPYFAQGCPPELVDQATVDLIGLGLLPVRDGPPPPTVAPPERLVRAAGPAPGHAVVDGTPGSAGSAGPGAGAADPAPAGELRVLPAPEFDGAGPVWDGAVPAVAVQSATGGSAAGVALLGVLAAAIGGAVLLARRRVR